MSEENTPKLLMEKMKQNELAEASDFITGVYNAVASAEVMKVPEPVFRELFLPAFLDNDTVAAQSARENWMGIVGSHASGADVVDIKGEVIFHVPPLVNTNYLNLNSTKKTLRGAFTEYLEDAPIHHQSAIGKLMVSMDQTLTGLYSGDELTKIKQDDIKDWENIFKYYGVIKDDGSRLKISNSARPAVEDDFEA